MADGILSYGDSGRDVGTYDTATDSPMTLEGEGSVGDAMVITAGVNVRPQTPGGGGSVGDVSREGVTVDNRIARWHGSGAEIQNTGVTIDDDDNISGYGTLTGGSSSVQLTDTVGHLRILGIGQNGATDRQAMLWDNGGGTWVVAGIVEGTGTPDFMPRWISGAVLGNSDMSDDGSTTTVLTNDFIVALGDVAIPTGNFGVGVASPLTDVHADMNAPATLSTLAGSVFLQAFNNAGDGNFGAGIIFGQPAGASGPTLGASIVVVQGTAGDTNAVGLDFNVHGTVGADPRFKALGIDYLGNVGVPVGSIKIGNATTVAPLGAADDLVVDFGVAAAGMTLVSTGVAQWIAADAGSNIAGTLAFIHATDEWTFAIGGVGQVSVSAGAATFSAKEKGGFSNVGGVIVKLTNDTGLNTVKGQIVCASTATDDAFDTCGSNSDDAMGIVLEAGIGDGSEAWVAIGGIADVLIDAGGCTHGDRVGTGATAGSADVINSPSLALHFQEIGHVLQTRVGAGLARVDLHFN